MSISHEKTPAPVATGNEGQKSTSLHDTERPGFYHIVAYHDADTSITKCRKRMSTNIRVTPSPPQDLTLCPLCDAAMALEAVIW